MAAVSEAADRICKCGDGFCPDSAEGIPALGEADHKLLHAWAWGTEPQPISPGQLQCCLQSILAEPHRSAKRKPDPAHKRRTSRQPQLAALPAAARKSGSVIQLSEHQGTHPALGPPERSQISAINPPPPPNASQYMADNSLADILILAVLCLAGIGSAAYVVLRRLQRVESQALGDVELQDFKRDEDLTFEGQVVKGDVFLPQGL